MGYQAFISYSHAADDRLAPRLQSALHRFAKPWYRLRVLRIFRDKTSLSASPELWPSIARALGASEFFILLASPEAAASPWVGREIAYWREHKPLAHVLIALTHGTLAWDEAAGDFDWSRTDAVPRTLAGAFGSEPKFVDLRQLDDPARLTLRDPVFREAVADLAAPLHGRPRDELAGEDIRQHRRTLRTAWAAVLVLATLTVLSSVLFVVARSQRELAQREAMIANARRLAAESVSVRDAYPQRAVLLAVEAMRAGPPAEPHRAVAEQALRDALAACPGRPLRGHAGPVLTLAFAPDGRTLYSGGADGTIRGWNVNAASADAAAVVLRGHGDIVNAIAISRDGHRLASASRDGTVRLWDLDRDDPAAASRVLPHGDVVDHVLFTPDDRRLVSTSRDEIVRVWDGTDRDDAAPALLLRHPGWVRFETVAVSPDGRWLATGSIFVDAIALWDLAAPDPATTGTALPAVQGVNRLAFTSDGRTLVAGEQGNRVTRWRLDDARGPPALMDVFDRFTSPVWSVAIDDDGRTLFAGDAVGTGLLWDLTAPDPTAGAISLRGHDDRIVVGVFRRGGRLLATGSADGTIRLWNLDDADPVATSRRLGGHDGAVLDVTIDEDGRHVASAGVDGSIRLWDLEAADPGSRTTRRAGPDGSTRAAALTPDGTRLITGGLDGVVCVWDAREDARTTPTFRVALGAAIDVIATTPDGRWIVVSAGGLRRLWDTTRPLEARPPITLGGGPGRDQTLAISPDGRWLVAGTYDGAVARWDLRDPTVATPPETLARHDDTVSVVAFSADTRWLLTGGRDGVGHLYDLTKPAGAPTPFRLVGHAGRIGDAVFDPDGRRLYTGGSEGVVLRWDLAQPDPSRDPIVLETHDGFIAAMAIDPVGRWLATGGGSMTDRDRTVHLRDVSHAARRAEPIALRGHTAPINLVRITPDGRRLVTAGEDETIRLWDLTADDPATTAVVLRPGSFPWAALVTPDGDRLFTPCEDGAVRTWWLGDPAGLIDDARTAVGRNFDPEEEWPAYFPGAPWRPTFPALAATTTR